MNREQQIQQYFETIICLNRSIRAGKRNPLKKTGINRAQFGLFFLIARNGKLSVKEIAGNLGVTSSAATQMINGLVKSEIVERVVDEKDRRVVIVQFSEKGRKQFENFKSGHLEKVNEMLKVLNNQELDQLLQLTMKIVAGSSKIVD